MSCVYMCIYIYAQYVHICIYMVLVWVLICVNMHVFSCMCVYVNSHVYVYVYIDEFAYTHFNGKACPASGIRTGSVAWPEPKVPLAGTWLSVLKSHSL